MPGILVQSYGWTIVSIEESEVRKGDLIFLRWKDSNHPQPDDYYITHVMLVLGPNRYFHSTCSGGKIQPLGKSRTKRVVDEPELFLRYVDRRSIAMRSLINEKDPEEITQLTKKANFSVEKDIGPNQFLSYKLPKLLDPGIPIPLSCWEMVMEYYLPS